MRRAAAPTRPAALSCFFRSARGIGRAINITSLRPPVRLFAPLRDKATPGGTSIGPGSPIWSDEQVGEDVAKFAVGLEADLAVVDAAFVRQILNGIGFASRLLH